MSQTRTLEILAQLRVLPPETDALMCELEVLTSYDENSVWNPEDGKGQAIKESARECYSFVATAMHGARAIIEDTLEMAQEWAE